MKGVYRYIILISISFFAFNCQKEISSSRGPVTENINPDPINAVVQGNVLDETGQPASGVSIKVGTKAAITDMHGYFRIMDASLDKKASLVSAEKAGYFKAYRTFGATSGANQVVIKLIKKTLSGTVDVSLGGSITMASGAKLDFPANGIVKASDGSSFSGTMNIYAACIDPTAADIGQTVPGSFMANDINNNRVSLASYGMMAVELESASGERLQVKQGSVATLTMPIPSSLQSSAPSSIAMWYVDEQTGIWKEEGTAVKNGTGYTGNVKHFTYWNCDISVPSVSISLTLKNNDGLPLVNVEVNVTSSSYSGSAHGYTDSLGQINGLVPANMDLVLKIYDPCHNVIHSQNIGPFSQATNLGVIVLNNPGTAGITFRGKLLDCNAAPVAHGYAIVYLDNIVRYASTDANGNFAVSFLRCAGSSATAQVLGVDETATQQGNLTTVNMASPLTDAGNISACGISAAEFLNYDLDGTSYSIAIAAADSMAAYTYQQGTTQYTTVIDGYTAPSNQLSLNFQHAALVAGSYPVSNLSVQGFTSGNTLIQPFNITITNFPQAIGDFYEGNLSGQFKDAQNNTHTLSATLRIRKQY